MGLVTTAVMQTDAGLVRARNEDSAYADPDGRYVVVADGMGGHGAGDVASAMAVDVVRRRLDAEAGRLAALGRAPDAEGRAALITRLRDMVEQANDEVYQRSVREPDKHQMGTTLEVVVVCGGEALICHVGDSRTYLVRDGAVTQLTVDHTVAETMRRAGTIDDATAAVSPLRSALANAIGVTADVSVDVVPVAVRPGDRLLVCSDGLHDYLPDDGTARLVGDGAPADALARLIALARAGGGHDNITGVMLEVRGRAAATAPPVGDFDDDDQITSPVAVPIPTPLGSVSDVSVANFVEQSLREQSRPHPAPAGGPRRRGS